MSVTVKTEWESRARGYADLESFLTSDLSWAAIATKPTSVAGIFPADTLVVPAKKKPEARKPRSTLNADRAEFQSLLQRVELTEAETSRCKALGESLAAVLAAARSNVGAADSAMRAAVTKEEKSSARKTASDARKSLAPFDYELGELHLASGDRLSADTGNQRFTRADCKHYAAVKAGSVVLSAKRWNYLAASSMAEFLANDQSESHCSTVEVFGVESTTDASEVWQTASFGHADLAADSPWIRGKTRGTTGRAQATSIPRARENNRVRLNFRFDPDSVKSWFTQGKITKATALLMLTAN